MKREMDASRVAGIQHPAIGRERLVRRGGPRSVGAALLVVLQLTLPALTVLAGERPLDARLSGLVAAYPDHLAGIEGNDLVWKDGTRMTIDDGRGVKDLAARLAVPDIKDMLVQPYPSAWNTALPVLDADPGRARPAAFFDKMYGDCGKDQVRGQLVDVVWLPRKWGKPLQVTRVNGVAQRIAAVSLALDALPAAFDGYLFPAAGTYNCRPIAGTGRSSPHGHGIAIDIATRFADYWRWAKPGPGGRPAYRNRIPAEIVEAFERAGFIWGGKWSHFDTMHFEYRPELAGRP